MTELLRTPVVNIESTDGPSLTDKFELPENKENKKIPWPQRMLCQMGIHSGVWVFPIEANCKQLKVCSKCGKTLQRVKHNRKWLYIKEGACEQVKTCLRCNEKGKQRTKHVWGPTYSAGSQDAHDCVRCQEHETWTRYENDYY